MTLPPDTPLVCASCGVRPSAAEPAVYDFEFFLVDKRILCDICAEDALGLSIAGDEPAEARS